MKTRITALATVATLLFTANAGATSMRLRARHYARTVVVDKLTNDLQEQALVEKVTVKRCWTIAPTIAGCRIESHVLSLDASEIYCATIATISERKTDPRKLKWTESDDSCWVPNDEYPATGR